MTDSNTPSTEDADRDARHKARMVRKKEVIDARIAAAQDERGVIVITTGNGKGKSSSGFGMVVRALGHGMRTGVVQFIKGAQPTGEEMFLRRASKGQCVNQPYLGCREFAADVRLVEPGSPQPPPIAEDKDLGWMLHDLDFGNPASPQPRFFRAEMKAGVIEVPAFDSQKVAA